MIHIRYKDLEVITGSRAHPVSSVLSLASVVPPDGVFNISVDSISFHLLFSYPSSRQHPKRPKTTGDFADVIYRSDLNGTQSSTYPRDGLVSYESPEIIDLELPSSSPEEGFLEEIHPLFFVEEAEILLPPSCKEPSGSSDDDELLFGDQDAIEEGVADGEVQEVMALNRLYNLDETLEDMATFEDDDPNGLLFHCIDEMLGESDINIDQEDNESESMLFTQADSHLFRSPAPPTLTTSVSNPIYSKRLPEDIIWDNSEPNEEEFVINDLVGFTDAALRMFIGSVPTKIRHDLRAIREERGTSLTTIVPSLWSPGFLPALSCRARFLPLVAHSLSYFLRNHESSSLKLKFHQVRSLSTSDASLTDTNT